MTVPIPIHAAGRIAEEYGYDQVVIVARKVGGNEHVTTYGVDEPNCDVAARIGNFFKHKLMGWPAPTTVEDRENFERWFAASRHSRGPSKRPTFERMEDGTYAEDHTQRHWWTWQNALVGRKS